MKAIKVYNIKWDLSDLDYDKKVEVRKTLPTSKSFRVKDDNYDVAENVPGLLRDKFGYNVDDFSFSEIPYFDDILDLIRFYTPRGSKPMKFFKASGEVSAWGDDRLREIKMDIKWRRRLEDQETPIDEFPKKLDTLMLSWCAITGLKWDEMETFEDIWGALNKIIREKAQEIVDSRPVKPRKTRTRKLSDDGEEGAFAALMDRVEGDDDEEQTFGDEEYEGEEEDGDGEEETGGEE